MVLRRQIDDGVAQQIRALRIKGVQIEPGYLRRYPENEAAAHVVGFTDIEDKGQEGIELAFQRDLQGHVGSRGIVKDRLGRVVEELGEPVDPRDGRDVQLTIDSKVQALAYQRLRDAVNEHKAKAGSVVVLDAQTGEILALANYPSFVPGERHNLTGGQLRNRAITDVFEPGSTVKPFVVARALEQGLVRPDMVIDTHPFKVGPLTVNDGEHGHPSLTVSQVIQKSSNIGTVKIAQKLENRSMGELYQSTGLWPEAADRLPRLGHRPAAPLEELAAGGKGHHGLWLRSVGLAAADRPRLHRHCARRRTRAGHAGEGRRAAALGAPVSSSRKPPAPCAR